MAGLTKKYANAFTIVSPAILDLGELTLLDRVSRKNPGELSTGRD